MLARRCPKRRGNAGCVRRNSVRQAVVPRGLADETGQPPAFRRFRSRKVCCEYSLRVRDGVIGPDSDDFLVLSVALLLFSRTQFSVIDFQKSAARPDLDLFVIQKISIHHSMLCRSQRLQSQSTWYENILISLQRRPLCAVHHFGPGTDKCLNSSANTCYSMSHSTVLQVQIFSDGMDAHILLECSSTVLYS